MNTEITPRHFRISIATLLREGQLVANALADERVGPAVVARFPKFNVTERYAQLRTTLENGGLAKSTKSGLLGALTQDKALAFTEMESLVASARRLAARSFRGNEPRLHAEFLIGDEGPKDLASEVDRARTIAAACRTHADELAEHGWILADTEELDAVVAKLSGTDGKKESSKQENRQLTNARVIAANAYYELTMDIVEAARRAYPSTRSSEEIVIKARGLFLTETFPPNPRRSGPEEAETPAPPPASSATVSSSPTSAPSPV